jgi:hypothetical protein
LFLWELALPDLDLIKQGEQEVRDRRGRILPMGERPRQPNSGLIATAVFAADLLQKQQR